MVNKSNCSSKILILLEDARRNNLKNIWKKSLWELPGAISGGISEGTASETLGSEILSGIFEINPGGISIGNLAEISVWNPGEIPVEIAVRIPVVIS